MTDSISANLVSKISQLNRAIETGRPSRSAVVLSSQAQQTLAARQELVEQLILTKPAAVGSVALKPEIAAALTPEQKALTENAGQWTGVLEKTVADNFETGKSELHWKLNTGAGRLDVVFPEGSKPEAYFGKRIQVTGIGTTNAVAAADFSLATTVRTAASRAVVQAQAGPVTSCSTFGSENVAVLMMNQGSGGPTFPSGITASYLQTQYFSSTPKSSSTYLDETSFSQTTATGTVFGPFSLGANYACSNYDALATAAINAAKTGGVDLSPFSRISIVFPENACSFGGLGDIGCRSADSLVNHPYSVTWIPILSFYNAGTQIWGTVAHEIGHNLGLNHSSSLDFGTIPLGAIDYTVISGGTPTGGTALQTEYGDPNSLMGDTSCGGQFASHDKLKTLNWITPSSVSEVNSNGNFTLVPYENSTGMRAVRVLRDPLTSSWLWLEYRQSIGNYDSSLSTCFPGTTVYQGALGYYESPASSDGHMFLLTFNPTGAPNSFRFAAMTPGQSWSDPYSPLRLNITSANSSGLALSVNYDPLCTGLSVSAPSFAATTGNGTVTVTAPGNCSWQASETSSWITFTGTTSGTGNGTIPFSLSANTSTDQRTGFITVSRNNIAVLQKGTATFVSPMNPVFGTGSTGTITFNLNDPLGANDFQYGRFYFSSNQVCEIDVTQSGGSFFFFVYNPDTGDFSPSLSPGQNQSYSNGRCALNGVGTSVTKNGNQIQMSLNMSFSSTIQGGHRVTASVCDGNAPGCTSESPIGTWQVTPPPSISLVSPNGVKQGFSATVTITGSGTHFTNSSVVTVSGTGVATSGISAASGTQLSAVIAVDPNATVNTRTLTVTTGSEVVTASFDVFSSSVVIYRPSRTTRILPGSSPGGVTQLAVALPTTVSSAAPISCLAPKTLGCSIAPSSTPGTFNVLIDTTDAPDGDYKLRLKTSDKAGRRKSYTIPVILKSVVSKDDEEQTEKP